MTQVPHTPLHQLEPGPNRTGGRLVHSADAFFLENAHRKVQVEIPDRIFNESQINGLVEVEGIWDGQVLSANTLNLQTPGEPVSIDAEKPTHREIIEFRDKLYQKIRAYFQSCTFLEVETPYKVAEPGTDVHLSPLPAGDSYLHTSPEFKMKQLLSKGFERIYQIAKVWRGNERTRLHNPEFSMLEWYRAWEKSDSIKEDTKRIVSEAFDLGSADKLTGFNEITISELSKEACHFDICQTQTFDELLDVCRSQNLLPDSSLERAKQTNGWDELFFELQVSYFDSYLADKGAVFVTDWPANLAILARRKDDNPDIAERFELYIDGIEIANGFEELTDPKEQARRFRSDLKKRKKLDKPQLPFPSKLITALERGIPPTTGIALGLDRLVMLATETEHIRQVISVCE